MELCGAQELIIIFDIKLRRCATAVPVNHKYVIKNCLDKTCLNRRKIREINADFIKNFSTNFQKLLLSNRRLLI